MTNLINHGHSLGHMKYLVDVIFTTHKGKHLDTDEKFHIKQKIKKKA